MPGWQTQGIPRKLASETSNVPKDPASIQDEINWGTPDTALGLHSEAQMNTHTHIHPHIPHMPKRKTKIYTYIYKYAHKIEQILFLKDVVSGPARWLWSKSATKPKSQFNPKDPHSGRRKTASESEPLACTPPQALLWEHTHTHIHVKWWPATAIAFQVFCMPQPRHPNLNSSRPSLS